MGSPQRAFSPARTLLIAGCLAALSATSPAVAQGRPDLEKARAAYLARNYAEAETRLRALIDPTTGTKERSVLSSARMVLGATLVAQGRGEQASDVFEKLILEDPAFEPDPLGFPGEVINAFIDTRARLQERLKTAAEVAAKLEAERRAREDFERRAREAWLEKVKEQAGTERVTVQNSRLVASIPFGAGQFQNRQRGLGWTFLGLESALLVATVITVPMYVYARDRANDEARGFDVDGRADAYQERAQQLRFFNIGFASGFALVAAAGVIQANAAFVPSFDDTRRRELPVLQTARAAGLQLHPTVSVGSMGAERGAPLSGLQIGAFGAF